MTDNPDPMAGRLLTEAEAAEILSLSTRTLRTKRDDGTGPRHCRFGRTVRYRRADLLAWIEAHAVARTGGDQSPEPLPAPPEPLPAAPGSL